MLQQTFKSDYASLHIQDLITTNSILAKHGINYASLNSNTPKEMAVLLGVEFVVYGIANVTNKGISSYGSGSWV